MSRRDHPDPREVPGYQDAVDRGLLHVDPRVAPRILPGRTAASRALRALAALGASTALMMVVVFGSWAPTAVSAAAVVGWGLLFVVLWRGIGERLLAELRAGYASFTFLSGSFWFERGSWLGWDFSGAWLLRGEALVEPKDPSATPPGLYPSPHRGARWELWTGRTWAGVFREPFA